MTVPDCLAIAGLCVGLDKGWISDGMDEDTLRVMEGAREALQRPGAVLVARRFPDPSQVVRDWFPLCGVEVAVAHAETWPSRATEYGASLAELIELGHSLSGLEPHRIVLRRLAFAGRVRAAFEGIDLLLVPVTGIATPTPELLGRFGANEAMLQFTSPFNMTRHPTITLPGGHTAAGLPVGVQLVAPRWREEVLVRAGAAFQRLTD